MKKTGFLSGRISKSNFKDFEGFIFAFCLYMIIPPFYVWRAKVIAICTLICSVLALKNYFKKKVNFLSHFIFFIGFLIAYSYFALNNERSIFGYIAMISVCSLFITSAKFLNIVLEKFIFIYSITLIPSIIVFLLIHIFGLNLLISIIKPLNELKNYDYSVYPFLVQPNAISDILIPRFCGYFDEPGVVGTISAVLLMCSGFNLKKAINIPIFIAGILSFSLAFFIVTFVYVFIFSPVKYKIISIIFILGCIYILSGNDLFKHYYLDRLEFVDGKFAGDNRVASGFDVWYEKFKESDKYYFGVGWSEARKQNLSGSSYKELIVAYGIIGFIYYISLCLLFALFQIRFRKEFLLYLFLLFTIIYQRPAITSHIYMFLIVASIPFLSESAKRID